MAEADILVSVYANLFSTTGDVLKSDGAVDKCKEGIVSTDTYVVTGMDLSAALSNKDVAGKNCLTVSLLNAETLRLGITAVFSRTNALLVSEEL